ncbi:ferrous iron transport protein B [Candidatus Formimonas warabiya]|uniref:Ferrous iron transport protein B n=1 Tax=Formimonas warabiya TaxID=1761012 RepID=A0A3G1KYR7_FORW1|nr:ferrous iron transport protein B [Candidatus Formimonas warabiya]ATW27591.1 ferrous iron transport protein B [Candidatus Formimonas warabiya]
MGLTSQSTGVSVLNNSFDVRTTGNELVIALGGNPNVGKSTVFNSLTGLNQHTGNWPGKTVINAQGRCRFKEQQFTLVDIPGTYSLMSNSVEEEIARDFVCFGKPDTTVVVTDATCLERNLNLVLQILEITDRVVVCVNLMDEAHRKKIKIDLTELSRQLGVPVIGTSARSKKGLNGLMDAVYSVAQKQLKTTPLEITYDPLIEQAVQMIEPDVAKLVGNEINSRWVSLKLLDGEKSILRSLENYLGFHLATWRKSPTSLSGSSTPSTPCMCSSINSEGVESSSELRTCFNPAVEETLAASLTRAKEFLQKNNIDSDRFRDLVVSTIVHKAEEICRDKVVVFEDRGFNKWDRKIDSILTSRVFGIPIMVCLLGIVFWLTIAGANVPSEMIATFLFWVEGHLTAFFFSIHAPAWLHGLLVTGVYRTLAWVVSVMLPPMAIFFPMFTLLEDLGYLPRVAFNLDGFFKRACAHGKQALTMCMGFGCNAAGVIGCRIIDSPRERLIATITNNFVPCNGRFPTLIAVSSIFLGGIVSQPYRSFVSTFAMVAVVLLGVFMTLVISKILSKTILKGMPSSFTLELPPYRKPQLGRILVRSILDRTLFVLARAVCVAAPAGLVIWGMANIQVGGVTLLVHCANFLQPFAQLIGLDGYILMAFILGLPANEIVVPIIIMSYLAAGSMLELDSLEELRTLLVSHGWTWLTGVCVMLFSLMHYPCGTTLWTIKKETQSMKWAFVSFLVPTITGIIVCFVVAQLVRGLGLAF